VFSIVDKAYKAFLGRTKKSLDEMKRDLEAKVTQVGATPSNSQHPTPTGADDAKPATLNTKRIGREEVDYSGLGGGSNKKRRLSTAKALDFSALANTPGSYSTRGGVETDAHLVANTPGSSSTRGGETDAHLVKVDDHQLRLPITADSTDRSPPSNSGVYKKAMDVF
jgi:hypothetical protein